MSYVCLIFLAFVLLNLDNSVRTVLHFALKGFWCQSELFSKAPRKELMSMQIWTPDQFNLLTSLLWCINSNRKDTQLLHLTLTMHLLNWKSLLWKGLQVLFPSVYRCWKLLHRWQSRMKQHWAVLNTGDFHGLRMVGHERRVFGLFWCLVTCCGKITVGFLHTRHTHLLMPETSEWYSSNDGISSVVSCKNKALRRWIVSQKSIEFCFMQHTGWFGLWHDVSQTENLEISKSSEKVLPCTACTLL